MICQNWTTFLARCEFVWESLISILVCLITFLIHDANWRSKLTLLNVARLIEAVIVLYGICLRHSKQDLAYVINKGTLRWGSQWRSPLAIKQPQNLAFRRKNCQFLVGSVVKKKFTVQKNSGYHIGKILTVSR